MKLVLGCKTFITVLTGVFTSRAQHGMGVIRDGDIFMPFLNSEFQSIEKACAWLQSKTWSGSGWAWPGGAGCRGRVTIRPGLQRCGVGLGPTQVVVCNCNAVALIELPVECDRPGPQRCGVGLGPTQVIVCNCNAIVSFQLPVEWCWLFARRHFVARDLLVAGASSAEAVPCYVLVQILCIR